MIIKTILVKGFPECYYFKQAKILARKMKKDGKVTNVIIQPISRTKFFQSYNSSPAIFRNGRKLRDGYSSLLKLS